MSDEHKVARVLCCNDMVMQVVLGGNEVSRTAYLERVRSHHWEQTKTALGEHDHRVKEYRNVYYWHYHDAQIKELP